jgi:hypothetical protein
VEIAEEGCQVAMGQVGLYLYFSKDVVLYFQLSNPLFRHLFDDANEAYGLLLSYKDLSEGTLSQFL